MSAADVEAAVIEPMLELYPPSKHLRERDGAVGRALVPYRRALERFSRPVLDAACRSAVPSAILTAMTRSPRRITTGCGPSSSPPWT